MYPILTSIKTTFRNGVTAEQVKQFFGEHPAFKVTWKTEQGEFTETIPLTFAEPN